MCGGDTPGVEQIGHGLEWLEKARLEHGTFSISKSGRGLCTVVFQSCCASSEPFSSVTLRGTSAVLMTVASRSDQTTVITNSPASYVRFWFTIGYAHTYIWLTSTA